MRILAISGSLRKGSYNRSLARAAQQTVVNIDPSIEFIILDWGDVPLFNQDIEFPAPEAVTRIRESVRQADGIWIFTPEHNHSYPGVLKNLLDWLSRPISKTEKQVLAGKPVAFCGTSPGSSGSTHAQEHLIPLLSYVGMQIMSTPTLAIPHIRKQLNEEGEVELQDSAPYLERQAKAFIAFIKEHSFFEKN